jgi:phenylpropionate dioxygenase-like ring-hydroxylating dioxygenase large terminal subunit
VLGNVCQHRGSLLVEDGPSNGSSFVCPYHRWAYRLDGSLIGGPLADGLDLSNVCLPRIRHTVWEGFVLVNLSGDAPDPLGQLASLSTHLAPWSWSELVTVGSRSFQSDWNWKVMSENWIECYHHLGTHRTTVEPTSRHEPRGSSRTRAPRGLP